MRVRVALAMALVALLAVTASAAATPSTPQRPRTAPLTALTLPLGSPAPDARSATGPADAPAATAPTLATLGEPGAPPLPRLGNRRQPAPKAGVVVKATPRPALPRIALTGHSLRGPASWYCNSDASRAQTSVCHYKYPDTGGFNAYAAAGPKLRAALGGGNRWRGRIVSVDGLRVKLVDWCQCYKGQSNEKLIDLYYDVFRRTGGSVTIRW